MMRRSWLALVISGAAILGAGACADPVSTEALLIPVVVVDSVPYGLDSTLQAESQTVGEKYAEVKRFVDCSKGVWIDLSTHVSDFCPLADGESNYLPAGTPIHRIVGVEPAEALTVLHGGVQEVLRPLPRSGEAES